MMGTKQNCREQVPWSRSSPGPREDQEELAEMARVIEARRTGVYRAKPVELQAIDEAERSGVATDEEVEATFSFGEASDLRG